MKIAPEERLLRSLTGTGENSVDEGGPDESSSSNGQSSNTTPASTSLSNATTTSAVTVNATVVSPPLDTTATAPAATTTPTTTPTISGAVSRSASGQARESRRRGKGKARDSADESDGPDDDDVQIGGDEDSWSGVDEGGEAEMESAAEPVRKLKPWEDTRASMTEYERSRLKNLERNHNFQVALGLIEELEKTTVPLKPKPRPVLRRVECTKGQNIEDTERRQSARLANKQDAVAPTVLTPLSDESVEHVHTTVSTEPALSATTATPTLASDSTEPNLAIASSEPQPRTATDTASITPVVASTAAPTLAPDSTEPTLAIASSEPQPRTATDTASTTPIVASTATTPTPTTAAAEYPPASAEIEPIPSNKDVTPVQFSADGTQTAACVTTASTLGDPTSSEIVRTEAEAEAGQENQNVHLPLATPVQDSATTTPATPRQSQTSLPRSHPTTPTHAAYSKPLPLSPATNRISAAYSAPVQPPYPGGPRIAAESNIVAPNKDLASAIGAVATTPPEPKVPSSTAEVVPDVVPFVNQFFDASKAPPKAHTEGEVDLLRELEDWCKKDVTEMVASWISVEKLMGYPARDVSSTHKRKLFAY